MKEIPLTQGKVALVDDDMYDYLMQWKWYATKNPSGKWYAKRRTGRRVAKTTFSMHRVVLQAPNNMYVDHINSDETLDNRRSNLRLCTKSENGLNRGKPKTNKSGYKGIYWNKANQKFCAEIGINRKGIYLGSFDTPEEAAHAYDAKAIELFGPFAKLNFPTA